MALAPVYRAYTARLRAEVLSRPVPSHVALIMDGNRRWAAAGRARLPAVPATRRRGQGDRTPRLVPLARHRRGDPVGALAARTWSASPDEVEAITEIATETLEALAVAKGPAGLRDVAAGDRPAGDLLPDRLREAASGAKRRRPPPRAGRDPGPRLLAAMTSWWTPAGRRAGACRGGRRPQRAWPRLTGEAAGGPPLHRRLERPGPHHPDERRGPPLRLPALAERLLASSTSARRTGRPSGRSTSSGRSARTNCGRRSRRRSRTSSARTRSRTAAARAQADRRGGGGEGGEGKGQAGQAGGKDDRTAAEKRADAEAEAAEKRAKAEGRQARRARADRPARGPPTPRRAARPTPAASRAGRR